MTSVWRAAPLCVMLFACDEGEAKPRPTLSREALLDPITCEGCHPTHYREWKASMHAYAADDPIFIAMNELGQQETDGGLGDFCVQCHAPMAVREGATTDGRNLDEVDDHLKGVTCYFCHNIESVEGDHNAQLTLANDTTMRGGIDEPVRPDAHRVMGSPFMGFTAESSRMCGACHDIVNGHGVHLERTFAEYEASTFGAYDNEDSFNSCTFCHMDERTDFAAVGRGLPDNRKVHSHLFAGVDVPLTPWPDREAYTRAVECALADGPFFSETAPKFDGFDSITVQVETNAGHNTPSGASQDRRLWIELTAYDEDDKIICTNGAVPDDQAVVKFFDDEICDITRPGVFRDIIYDADGVETHMFWRAAPSDEWPNGFSDYTILPVQQGSLENHVRPVTFRLPFEPTLPARLRLRLRMRAMDHDVLEELLERGLLDESIPAEIPTFTIIGGERELLFNGTFYEWAPWPPRTLDCEAVACEFRPEASDCK